MTITRAYLDRQRERIGRSIDAIVSRERAVKAGRIVPAAGALPIGTGRRLDATVLFLDISGFSSQPSNTLVEQEALLHALSLFFGEMFAIVADSDGTVEKNTGDGLMAYFVGSAARTAQQAGVAAAMTMMKASACFIDPVLAASAMDPIRYRVCLDHGPILVAEVGVRAGFRSIVAIGATANIASKMLAHAEPGQILLGASMVAGLPSDWIPLLYASPSASGFSYVSSGEAYPMYIFDGRWGEPA